VSTFAWLDYSERQRRRMLEVVEMFREEGTVDELGLGAARDALADTMFPGTSTLHTRPRYLLFIPWIYRILERSRTPSDQVATALKNREVRLIGALDAGGENEGVIGIEARAKLKRFPSVLYWSALGTFGIRQFKGSQQQYHRSLDAIYQQRSNLPIPEADVPSGEGTIKTWDARVPGTPEGWLDATDFDLTFPEADYLQQRILEHAPGSYLAHLVRREDEQVDGDFAWDAPHAFTAPPTVRNHLEHARNFSELMHGAALLYNLILAEKVNDARTTGAELDVEGDRRDEYRTMLLDWNGRVEQRAESYADWNRAGFWALVRERNPLVSQRTVWFVDQWIAQALTRNGEIADDETARALVAEREIAVKRGLARVSNLRALERWSGASGVGQLVFRWPQGRRYAQDIIDGLSRS